MKRTLDHTDTLSDKLAGLGNRLLGEQMPRAVIDKALHREILCCKLRLEVIADRPINDPSDMCGVAEYEWGIKELRLWHPTRQGRDRR